MLQSRFEDETLPSIWLPTIQNNGMNFRYLLFFIDIWFSGTRLHFVSFNRSEN